jgi:Chitobiase/beta-hexosaminidase C-terminal domain
MRAIFFFLVVLCSLYSNAQEQFQLAPPLLKYNSIFFSKSAQVTILFAQKGATIHYTLDGKEPVESSPLYKSPLILSRPFTTLKVKSFARGYRASEVSTVSFIKSGLNYSIKEQSTTSDKYKGQGPLTLNDNKGGFSSLGSATWLGYNIDTVTYTFDLGKKTAIKELLFDFLQNESSWVFLPERILVYYRETEKGPYTLFGDVSTANNSPTKGANCIQQRMQSPKKVNAQSILIKIVPVKKMPDWHEAKGEHAWLFIDEIKVY